jgi:uncharacterized protein YijF (DUF1287 family)
MRFILFLFISIHLHSQNTTTKISLADAAIQLTKDKVVYDPTYVVLKYPMGDVPANKGVCTDVVIRAYRTLGIDLQVLVHEDMSRNFSIYPKKWGREKN